jgi:hypothetical protein
MNKMKTLSLILAVLFSSVLCSAGTFTYDRVQLIETGSDFKMSQQTIVEKVGTIILDRKVIIIDNKEYKLKETKDRWKYRIKGGIVQLDYDQGNLVAVRMHQYNQIYKYCIQTEPLSVTQTR